MNILEELYYGNIHPFEKSFARTSKYAALLKTMVDNEEKLTAFLEALPDTKEEQRLFSELLNTQSEVQTFQLTNEFIEGFQLGARFMLDALVLPQQSAIRDIG